MTRMKDPRTRLVHVSRDKLVEAIKEAVDRVFDEAGAANEVAHEKRRERLNREAEASWSAEGDIFWEEDNEA